MEDQKEKTMSEAEQIEEILEEANAYDLRWEVDEWAKKKITEFHLSEVCTVLFSPIFNEINPDKIVEWILEDAIPVRFQMQVHKYIWEPGTMGV